MCAYSTVGICTRWCKALNRQPHARTYKQYNPHRQSASFLFRRILFFFHAHLSAPWQGLGSQGPSSRHRTKKRRTKHEQKSSMLTGRRSWGSSGGDQSMCCFLSLNSFLTHSAPSGWALRTREIERSLLAVQGYRPDDMSSLLRVRLSTEPPHTEFLIRVQIKLRKEKQLIITSSPFVRAATNAYTTVPVLADELIDFD